MEGQPHRNVLAQPERPPAASNGPAAELLKSRFHRQTCYRILLAPGATLPDSIVRRAGIRSLHMLASNLISVTVRGDGRIFENTLKPEKSLVRFYEKVCTKISKAHNCATERRKGSAGPVGNVPSRQHEIDAPLDR